ncbi:hypothetical protein PCANC_22865 [Puccinia coronata f. sp. avenae]|uniref:Uncharacterized protein n=1 Tax=Puccinia coronata f. sp. avenae TaxID=200324 RepID=A0A2N5U730_9BASI|nr:hypothetical protein PCANC_22865 [Puccinia coronata f. sp. avenae]PLW35272.1 hypothetical protein PCASD_13672 [Puccinia coronata f. sp. avenae]
MKTIVKLLIVGAQLAISCTGMDPWDSIYATTSEDIPDGFMSDWSGEDNRILQQLTSTSLPQASSGDSDSGPTLASHIGMAGEEKSLHQLVFDMAAFAPPPLPQVRDENVVSRQIPFQHSSHIHSYAIIGGY